MNQRLLIPLILFLCQTAMASSSMDTTPLDEMGRLLTEWQELQNGIQRQADLPQHLDDELQKLLNQSEDLDKTRSDYERDCVANQVKPEDKPACAARAADIDNRFKEWNQHREEFKSSSDRATTMRKKQAELLQSISQLRSQLSVDAHYSHCKEKTDVYLFYKCASGAGSAPQTSNGASFAPAANQKGATETSIKTLAEPIMPDAVFSSAGFKDARIVVLDGRISRLKKARDIVDDKNNFLWELNWNRLRQEARKANDPFLWEGFDFVTRNLLEENRWTTEQNLRIARGMALQDVWANTAAQKRAIERLMASANAAEHDALKKSLRALEQLDRAQQAGSATEMLTLLRDAAATLYESHQRSQVLGEKSEAWNRIYDAGLLFGRIGIIFSDQVRPGSQTASFLNMILDEDKQLRTLSDRSYNRQEETANLDRQINALQQERATL